MPVRSCRPGGGALSARRTRFEGTGKKVGALDPVDGEAWLREIHDQHGAELYRLARRLLGDDGAAQDLLQEVLLKAWRSRASYDSAIASRRTWLFAMVRNAAVDAARARAVRPVLASERQPGSGSEPAVPDEVDRLVRVAELRDALSTLPPAMRDAVVLTQAAGFTYAETGERLGVPAGTVKSRVHHGLARLRDEMTEEGR